MDIHKQIIEQIELIKITDSSIYLDAIKIHLERAEYYFNEGKSDSLYFNDVIYRTNQAFEGALKESYIVLAEKESRQVEKETPYKIEKYFEQNEIFKDRVLELFSNYRNQWRNKSTHDYQLFFDENEAFIALINVSAFVHLLLKQIQEKTAFESEKSRLSKSATKLDSIKNILKADDKLLDTVTKLLKEFIIDNKLNEGLNQQESVTNGMLNAFLSETKDYLNIRREPLVGKHLRPDFIISSKNEKLIIEVKRFLTVINIEPAVNQLIAYMNQADINTGILFAFCTKPNNEVKIKNLKRVVDGKNFNINIIEN